MIALLGVLGLFACTTEPSVVEIPEGATELTVDASGDVCPDTDTDTVGMSASMQDDGTVYVHRNGPSEGCACGATATAWALGDEGTLTIAWDDGDCGEELCCDQVAVLSGVPAGTWTVVETYGALSATVTVP